ncbi:MAG TPA: hypothetical protein VMN03_13245, partial [Burkholderiales bacterium]|nr:hypothetical protein [Burkholderiales bacterium]
MAKKIRSIALLTAWMVDGGWWAAAWWRPDPKRPFQGEIFHRQRGQSQIIVAKKDLFALFFSQVDRLPMTADAKAPSSTATIALLLMWSMGGYSTAADNPPASGPVAEPLREIRYAPRLRANLSSAERYVVKGVCEHRGLREISQILRHSDVEEMWAFLPRAQGTRDCQWHEIGREEKAESDRSTLRVDMKYL